MRSIPLLLSILLFLPGILFVNQVFSQPSSLFCKSCHENNYGEWNNTKHSSAYLDTLFQSEWSKEGKPSYCLKCHVTNSMYLNEGVSCASCHNWVEGHPQTGPLEVNFSVLICAKCHEGSHHPFYEDWIQSKHASSLDTLEKIGMSKNDECLLCHSSEDFVSNLTGKNYRKEVLNPVNCQLCHDAHKLKLRIPETNELCGTCHTGVFHPTFEVFKGGFHNLARVNCSDCHMYRKPYQGIEEPAITGHSFKIDKRACMNCHGVLKGILPFDEAWKTKNEIQKKVSEKLNLTLKGLKETEEAIRSANSTILKATGIFIGDLDEPRRLLNLSIESFEKAEVLLQTVKGEGSKGFHNAAWTIENILKTEEMMDKAKLLAEEAVKLVDLTIYKNKLLLNLERKSGNVNSFFAFGALIGLLLGFTFGFIYARMKPKRK